MPTVILYDITLIIDKYALFLRVEDKSDVASRPVIILILFLSVLLLLLYSSILILELSLQWTYYILWYIFW